MLREVLDTAREKLVCELLLDLREATEARLNDAELHELAESLKDYPSLFWRKMALLLPPDAPGMKASRFQIRANSLGFDVQTFKEFEKAIYWLSTVQEVARAGPGLTGSANPMRKISLSVCLSRRWSQDGPVAKRTGPDLVQTISGVIGKIEARGVLAGPG